MPMGRSIGQRRRIDPPDVPLTGSQTSMDPLDTDGTHVVLDSGTDSSDAPLFGGVDNTTDPGAVGNDEIGTIAFHVNDMTVTGDLLAGPALVSADETVILHVHWHETATDWTAVATVDGTDTSFTVPGAMTDLVQFAVDSAGNVAILAGDTIVGPNDQAILGELFSGKEVVAGVMVDPNGSSVPPDNSVDVTVSLEPTEALDVIAEDSAGLVEGTVGRLF